MSCRACGFISASWSRPGSGVGYACNPDVVGGLGGAVNARLHTNIPWSEIWVAERPREGRIGWFATFGGAAAPRFRDFRCGANRVNPALLDSGIHLGDLRGRAARGPIAEIAFAYLAFLAPKLGKKAPGTPGAIQYSRR